MTIIDNAFQLILFAERNYLVHDPELKSLKWMVDDVNSLREKIDSIENSLKNPHKVKRGDSHWKISYNYLTKQAGLEKEQARDLLRRTALVDNIIPGFFTFNLYYDDVFLTTLTLGEAKISPTTVRLMENKKEINQV